MKPFQMAFGVLVQFFQTVALTELRHAYSCTGGGGETIACYKKDEYRGGVPRFCKTYCLCLTLYDGKNGPKYRRNMIDGTATRQRR